MLGVRPIRVLDNQPVRAPPFAGLVTFLYNALPRWIGALVRKAPQRGIVEGIVMFVIARRFHATITVGTGESFSSVRSRVFSPAGACRWRRSCTSTNTR